MTAGGDGASRLRIVLDTSVLTNPASAAQFGPDAAAAVRGFVERAMQAPGLEFYMPPSIFEELQRFLEPETLPARFELAVHLRAPERYAVRVSGSLLYELIEDIRERVNRGLRVAEKAVRAVQPDNLDKTLGRLRDEYRSALRAGLIDSKEDVDLVLLAKELEAALVSSDKGVVTWAEKLGLRLIRPEHLGAILEELTGPTVPGRSESDRPATPGSAGLRASGLLASGPTVPGRSESDRPATPGSAGLRASGPEAKRTTPDEEE